MRPRTLFALCAATLFASTVPAVDLVTNGSFETTLFSGNYALVPNGSTDIAGWTATLNGVEWAIPSTYGGGLGGAADGLATIDLATYTYSAGGIEQTLATDINQQYEVTFKGGTSNAFGRTGTGQIELTVGSLPTATFNLTNHAAAIDWTPLSFTFTASATSTTIAFANHEDAYTHFAFLDDVSVVAIPEPATVAALFGLFALGVVVVTRVRRTRRSA